MSRLFPTGFVLSDFGPGPRSLPGPQNVTLSSGLSLMSDLRLDRCLITGVFPSTCQEGLISSTVPEGKKKKGDLTHGDVLQTAALTRWDGLTECPQKMQTDRDRGAGFVQDLSPR